MIGWARSTRNYTLGEQVLQAYTDGQDSSGELCSILRGGRLVNCKMEFHFKEFPQVAKEGSLKDLLSPLHNLSVPRVEYCRYNILLYGLQCTHCHICKMTPLCATQTGETVQYIPH